MSYIARSHGLESTCRSGRQGRLLTALGYCHSAEKGSEERTRAKGNLYKDSAKEYCVGTHSAKNIKNGTHFSVFILARDSERILYGHFG